MNRAIVCLLKGERVNKSLITTLKCAVEPQITVKCFFDLDNFINDVESVKKQGYEIPLVISEKQILTKNNGEAIALVRRYNEDIHFIIITNILTQAMKSNPSLPITYILRETCEVNIGRSAINTIENYDLRQKVRAQDSELAHLSNTVDDLLDRSYTKNRLYSVVAHDLNMSISNLNGFSSLLDTDYDQINEEEKRKFTTIIRELSDSSMQLLENLLIWTKGIDNSALFRPQRISIINLVDNEIDKLNQILSRKKLSLQKHISPTTKAFVDPNMFSVIIRNLLLNIVDDTETGYALDIHAKTSLDETIVQITATNKALHNRQIKYLESIFNTSEESMDSSMGLGLILCREFLQRNNATIKIQHNPSKGNEYILRFPSFEPTLVETKKERIA